MNLSRSFRLALVGLVGCWAGSLSHSASITALGVQAIGADYEARGIAWMDRLVPKEHDVDRNSAFGSAGYWLAKITMDPKESYTGGLDLSSMLASPPSWLIVAPTDPRTNGAMNYGYRRFQDPRDPGEKVNVGYMGRLFSGLLVKGEYATLYDFTVGDTAPADFAITIAVHDEAPFLMPSGLVLEQVMGPGKGAEAELAKLPAVSSQEALFVTFRISGARSGDVFRLSGKASSDRGMAINAIFVDVVGGSAAGRR